MNQTQWQRWFENHADVRLFLCLPGVSLSAGVTIGPLLLLSHLISVMSLDIVASDAPSVPLFVIYTHRRQNKSDQSFDFCGEMILYSKGQRSRSATVQQYSLELNRDSLSCSRALEQWLESAAKGLMFLHHWQAPPLPSKLKKKGTDRENKSWHIHHWIMLLMSLEQTQTGRKREIEEDAVTGIKI